MGAFEGARFVAEVWGTEMSENFDDLVQQTVINSMRNTGVSEIPEQVMEASKLHAVKLGTLIKNLRAAGVDEQMVRQSISQLLKSYEAELLEALLALPKGDQA